MFRAETHKNYTKQQLEELNKDSLIDLYISQQDQMKELDKKMQMILEQMVTSNRARFGRSSEKLPAEGQIRFAEVDGTIVFFNEAEAVNDAEGPEDPDETAGSGDGKKKNKPPVKTKGQKEQALSKLPTRRVDHDIPADELEKLFGRDGWKRLPDEVYRRLEFIPAKVEVEEHHVAVYAAKDESHMEKAKHPAYLLRNSLVTPSLLAAIINGKYVNAVPLYRLEKEFERYGIPVTRQNMANWVIQGSERYLSIFYDYLHRKLYGFHVIQADETRVEVTKDGRNAGAMSWMWVYRTGSMYEDRAVVLYDYQKDRKTDHPLEFLKGFSGICETDGYQVYHKMEGMKEDLKIAGCWAHYSRSIVIPEEMLKAA